MKKLIALILLFTFVCLVVPSCKVKRCAQFDNTDGDSKLKRDRQGRVKR